LSTAHNRYETFGEKEHLFKYIQYQAGTYFINAQFDTIRLKLLKIGAEARELKTKLHFILPGSCPVKDIFATIVRNIALLMQHISLDSNINISQDSRDFSTFLQPKLVLHLQKTSHQNEKTLFL